MRLFISYRRSDSQQVVDQLETRLRERLAGVEIFRDVGGIEPGDNWKKLISEKIDTSDMMLVIIGPDWLTAEKNGERRLNDPSDIVCYEIASALSKGIRLIPVLVKGASFPDAEDLPLKIQGLAWINAHTISQKTLDADTNRLIKRLGLMLGTTIQEQPNAQAREDISRLIQELSLLIKNDRHVEDFESYWRWFLKAKQSLREFSTGTQVANDIKRLDLLLSEAKDGDASDRELTMLEIEATLDKIRAYFSTTEEQKIDDQQSQATPGKVYLLPGVDLKDFPVSGRWRCEVSDGSANISIMFNLANDGTITGALINANGKNRIDGNYMLNIWTPPDKDRYMGSPPDRIVGLRLSGLMNRFEPFDFEIPIEERLGRGFRGTDQQGRIFFMERE